MGGHARIAQAIAWGLTAAEPAVEIQIVDIYSAPYVGRRVAFTTNAYDRFVARAPWLWGAVFYASRPRPMVGLVRRVGSRLTRRTPLRRLVVEEAPDVIVSVISDLGQLGVLPTMARRRPPVVTVVSDLVNIHRGWLSPQADLILVPTEPAYEACRRYKVPLEKLKLVGYPVRSHLFCQEALAAGPRLPGGLRILFMGGSSGSGRMEDHIAALVAAGVRLEITAVCGKNGRLQRRLAALAAEAPAGVKLEPLGYTERIPQLMREADVLITKAGPSTLFEAIVCRLPAILTAHLPGQEGGNAQFFERAGVAVSSSGPAHTARLAASFAADPSLLDRLRQPQLAQQTCAATPRIAEIILEQAGSRR